MISQKVVDGFRQNLVDRVCMWQGWIHSILVKIWIQIRIREFFNIKKWFFTIERWGQIRYVAWYLKKHNTGPDMFYWMRSFLLSWQTRPIIRNFKSKCWTIIGNNCFAGHCGTRQSKLSWKSRSVFHKARMNRRWKKKKRKRKRKGSTMVHGPSTKPSEWTQWSPPSKWKSEVGGLTLTPMALGATTSNQNIENKIMAFVCDGYPA